MESLALYFSLFGRLAPKTFARAVVAVYVTAFVSQLLISPVVMLRLGLAPFALVQATAMWAWFCLHAKRLRDADRPLSLAVAIAVLAARDWKLPEHYIRSLARWAPSRWRGPRARDTGEVG